MLVHNLELTEESALITLDNHDLVMENEFVEIRVKRADSDEFMKYDELKKMCDAMAKNVEELNLIPQFQQIPLFQDKFFTQKGGFLDQKFNIREPIKSVDSDDFILIEMGVDTLNQFSKNKNKVINDDWGLISKLSVIATVDSQEPRGIDVW
jgi:hypothetical protein